MRMDVALAVAVKPQMTQRALRRSRVPSLLSLLMKTHLVLQMKVFLGRLTRPKVSFVTLPLNSSIQAARRSSSSGRP
eukprot:3740561-Pleurochrysis_carterae.AAC.1